MTETIEPTGESDQIAALQQQIRQAEVDCAYWRGRCESLEQNLNVTPAVTVAKPAEKPAVPPPNFSPEKLLPLLQPILSNPDILKLLLPLLKNLSAPRPAADG